MPLDHIFHPRLIGGLLLLFVVVRVWNVVRGWNKLEPQIITHFSPKGGCTFAIIQQLALARREILVQAYSFTCPDIAKALVTAAKRRIKVVVVLDRSNEEESYSAIGDLQGHGVKVLIDSAHAIAHNKVMVIDSRTVITGSFNFTRQAENQNAENLVILKDHAALATVYRVNFNIHCDHSHAPGKRPNPVARVDDGHAKGNGPHAAHGSRRAS
jgi:phosphatidylserine/phosphatidylglycerophosphate/cardiolipin synthase-like enzyme